MTISEIVELTKAGFTKSDIMALAGAAKVKAEPEKPETKAEPEKPETKAEPEKPETQSDDPLIAMQNSITQLTAVVTAMQRNAALSDVSSADKPDDITNIIAQMIGANAPEK